MQTNEHKLIEDNMKLVYYLIHKYYPSFATDEDLVQAGMIGLCQAANTWDESKSQFSTFACKCILNAFRLEFRSRRKYSSDVSLNNKPRENKQETYIDTLQGSDDVQYFDMDGFRRTLTKRENEVFDLLLMGLNTKEVQEKLNLTTPQGAAVHIRRIKLKWRKFNGD